MRNPNGFGSVVKLSGKRRKPYGALITIGYDDDGKQKRKFIGYSETKKGATKILLDYSDNPTIYQKNITLAELFEKWSKIHFKKIGDSGISAYKTAWKKCGKLYKMDVKDITFDILQSTINDSSNDYSPKKQIKVLFNQLFKYALKYDYVVKDYSRFVDIGKHIIKNKREPFSNDEIEILWQKLKEIPEIDVILILIYTGFRINELLELKCESVNIDDSYIRGGKKTKAGKNRLVPINSKIKPLILNRLKNKNSDNYLITNMNNNKMAYMHYYKIFNKIMSSLKMSHTIHDTRHTFATLLNNSDVNATAIKKLIGHSSFEITEKIYTHKNIDELKKAVEKI